MMVLRYLILAARDAAAIDDLAQASAARTALQVRFCAGRIAILANRDDAIVAFDNDRGAVIGTMFRAGGGTAKAVAFNLAANLTDPLPALQRNFWGAYVAVIQDEGMVTIARDPSGLLPCLYLERPDLVAFASDAALLEEAGLLTPEMDWPALARLLYANELPQTRMALAGLSDLHAGSAARMGSGSITIVQTWSPRSIVSARSTASIEELAGRLEQAVDQCLAAWASEHGRIVIAVSGGLDSSIVASSLARRKGPMATGLTISTDDSRGDESDYAQALCDHLGLDLCKGRYDEAAADLLTSACAHLPRPGGRAQLLAYDAAVHLEMARLSADALFTGSGGDNVFNFTHSARPLIDRYLAYGLHRGLIETARDIARLTGASLWTVLRYALKVPRGRGPKHRWRGDARFFDPDVALANEALPLSHPWLDAPDDCLPGASTHVAMILRAQHYHDNYDRRLPFAVVHPLLSQPIVEAMLAAPSWESVRGGRDRAIARKAFDGRFPKMIAERRFKGGPDAFATRLLRSNLPLVRERLLDGALCKHGILDRAALEPALTEAGLSRGHDYVRLLLLLDTEAWIDSWSRGPNDRRQALPIGRPPRGGAGRKAARP